MPAHSGADIERSLLRKLDVTVLTDDESRTPLSPSSCGFDGELVLP
jgi:hypothetical protein